MISTLTFNLLGTQIFAEVHLGPVVQEKENALMVAGNDGEGAIYIPD